jgi:MFS family permease
MPTPVTPEFRTESRSRDGFTALYGALLLLSLHWAVVLYINSSYLEQYVTSQTVSAFYIVGAIITCLSFLYASPLLSRFGNIRVGAFFTILEFVSLLGMAFTHNLYLAVAFFVLHQAVVPVLLFNLDVLLEELIGSKEESTGEKRGLLLSIMSLTGALAALGMGKLAGTGIPDFQLVYIASALVLIPFFYILVTKFKNFKDPDYPHFKIFEGLTNFWKYRDVRNVFFAHFLLQLFFTWMVIYTPLYLATVIGFHWEQIGIILFAGLMAYVFLEYVIGLVADKYLGEKEMMAFGFAIIAISTSWFVFLDSSSVITWMMAMFMTRVGASFVETTTESYFFKHTESKDTNIIGLFRVTRPLSYVLGAALGTLTLHYLDFHMLFVILGILMIPGLFFAMALKDTK